MLCISPACAGEDCKHQCECPDGAICKRVDGTCLPVSMCDAGYQGEDCTSQKGIQKTVIWIISTWHITILVSLMLQ